VRFGVREREELTGKIEIVIQITAGDSKNDRAESTWLWILDRWREGSCWSVAPFPGNWRGLSSVCTFFCRI